jgi:DnaJ-class molecular chaperone
MGDIMRDYYKTLQVDPEASREVIEKAYKALSQKYHPDKFAAASKSELDIITDKWIKVREAYEVLCDENKRNAYDRVRKREVLTVFWKDGLVGLVRKYFR